MSPSPPRTFSSSAPPMFSLSLPDTFESLFPSISSEKLDDLVGLCAGRSARVRIERNKSHRLINQLSSSPESERKRAELHGETWADEIGGRVAGVREAQSSFVKPWAEPNFGITFRYRHEDDLLDTSHPGLPLPLVTSESFRRDTFTSRSQKPDVVPNRAGMIFIRRATLHDPSDAIDIRGHTHTGPYCEYLFPHTLPHFADYGLRNESCFPAKALPKNTYSMGKRPPLDLAPSCEQRRRIEDVSRIASRSWLRFK